MFGATFNLVTGAIVIFGTLNDNSLKSSSSALNNCFSYRNVFQHGVNALSKLTKNGFLSALVLVAGKSFNDKIAAKIDFPFKVFNLTIIYSNIGSLQCLHTYRSFDYRLDHMLVKFEQNRMGRSLQNIELSEKNGSPFWQIIDVIFENVSEQKQLFGAI